MEKENKKRNGALVLIILAACIMLLLIGAYLYFNNDNSSKKVDTQRKVTHSKYTLKDNNISSFDLYFMKLNNNNMNEVYSPLSIKYALLMLSDGAKGETKKQIDDIIGSYSPKYYQNNSNMSFANAMFIRNTFKDNVLKSYTDDIKTKYNGEVIYDDFTSPNNINNWVSKNTFNLINNLLDDVNDYDFVLVNALAIDMNWNYKLQSSSSQSSAKDKYYSINYSHEKFNHFVNVIDDDASYETVKFNNNINAKASHIASSANRYDIVSKLGEDNIRKTITDKYTEWLNSEEGKMEVQYDNSLSDVSKNVEEYITELKSNYNKNDVSTDFSFYTDDNLKVFAKDLQTYQNTTLQYVAIMPTKEDLKDYVSKVSSKDISDLVSKLKDSGDINSYQDGVVTQLDGLIPLFNYDYTLDLNSSLKKLGITNIYDRKKSDFSNMLKSDSNEVIDTVHKANIEFSNEGIKASAATAAGGLGAASGGFEYLYDVPIVKINLDFDKPYMYIIRDKSSGEVWFIGTVYSPLTK